MAAAQSQLFQESTVFTGTFEGQGNYRIPAVITANDGSVIAFSEGRYSGTDPGSVAGRNRIVWRRSTDFGQTWSPQQTFSYTYVGDASNPVAVADRVTGDLFIFYNKWPSGEGQSNVSPGITDDSCTVWYRKSSDNGQTWSNEVDVTATVKDASWRGAALGPGSGVQFLRSNAGRLMVSGQRTTSTNSAQTIDPWVFYSDDHGATWTRGGTAEALYPDNGDENHVVELNDGSLLLDARQSSGTARQKFQSWNGGTTWTRLGTWHPGTTPIAATTIRYSSVLDGDDANRILFSAPAGGTSPSRENLTVGISYDEGETFSLSKLIHSGFAAYSSMTVLNDGSIGILYEVDNYGAITFTRVDLEYLGEQPVPEPATILGLGLGVGWLARKRKRKS